MNKWRPSGWENNYRRFDELLSSDATIVPSIVLQPYSEVFEAGADAMLDKLRHPYHVVLFTDGKIIVDGKEISPEG